MPAVLEKLEQKTVDLLELECPEEMSELDRRGVRAVSVLGTISLGTLAAISLRYGIEQVTHKDMIMPFSTESNEHSWHLFTNVLNVGFAALSLTCTTIGVSLATGGSLVMNRLRRRYKEPTQVTGGN